MPRKAQPVSHSAIAGVVPDAGPAAAGPGAHKKQLAPRVLRLAGSLLVVALFTGGLIERAAAQGDDRTVSVSDLPRGESPQPRPFPHFPSRIHAYVWRNWQLVPAERLAAVVGARRDEIVRIGHSMGLSGPIRGHPWSHLPLPEGSSFVVICEWKITLLYKSFVC